MLGNEVRGMDNRGRGPGGAAAARTVAAACFSSNRRPRHAATAPPIARQGQGLSPKQMRLCDAFVYIPQHGPGTASLNVTVAASIVLHHFATWARLPERGRDGAKFVVGERPQRVHGRGEGVGGGGSRVGSLRRGRGQRPVGGRGRCRPHRRPCHPGLPLRQGCARGPRYRKHGPRGHRIRRPYFAGKERALLLVFALQSHGTPSVAARQKPPLVCLRLPRQRAPQAWCH
jgi:hypothetical protein